MGQRVFRLENRQGSAKIGLSTLGMSKSYGQLALATSLSQAGWGRRTIERGLDLGAFSVLKSFISFFSFFLAFFYRGGITNPIRMCSAFFQCISPGLVETGFAFKLHDNDPERAAATYESIRVGHGEMAMKGSGSVYSHNSLSPG